jgi:pyridoxal biosynthesis lyase PdxS
MAATGTSTVKIGMAKMLKGGVIMDVVTPEQARIAEEAGDGQEPDRPFRRVPDLAGDRR